MFVRNFFNIEKPNESGRSMVEMLGVLAIIGVLSIGGIAGYKMAMTKHAENNVLNVLDSFYVGYIAETNNSNSWLYKSTSVEQISSHGLFTTDMKMPTEVFVKSYGLDPTKNAFNVASSSAPFRFVVNSFQNQGESQRFLELGLVIPRSMCPTVLLTVAGNKEMKKDFSHARWGTTLPGNKLTQKEIKDYCDVLRGRVEDGPDMVRLVLAFYFP